MCKIVVSLVILGFFASLPAWGQDQATIVGTVTDSTGAVVPGAKVIVANADKGFARNLVTNSEGAYQAPALPVGDYTVTAEVAGFRKLARSGITLTAGQVQRVDMQLQVGHLTEEVTVTGNVPHVQTETAAISDLVTGSQINNLEINGRNFVALAALVPGATPDNGQDNTHLGLAANIGLSFNGSRMEYNSWEIDGGMNNDDTSGGNSMNTWPSLDSIAEFRIFTSTYGADKGKHAGANVEVVTKSGTKQLHGDVYDYVRNDAFDANDWFANRQIAPPGGNAPKTPLKRNDYGYTIGGPFYIPGHYNTDKSKTFFFWSNEWRKDREGTVISNNVPSVRMRRGDFSECDTASPNYNLVAASGCILPVDPTTGNPFPNDTVPIDPNAKAFMDSLVPQPNNGVIGYLRSPSLPTDWRQFQGRIDQNISDKTSVFVRFTLDSWNTISIPPLWVSGNYDTVRSNTLERGKSAVLHLTHTFKPTLVNEFIMGYTDDPFVISGLVGKDSIAHSLNKPSTWTAGTLFAPNASLPQLPSLTVCGGTPFCITQDTGYYPFISHIPEYLYKDNASWSVGNHFLKFGFYLEKLQENSTGFTEPQGNYYFYGGGAVTSGNALADMYLARIQQYSEATEVVKGVPIGGNPKGHWRVTEFEPYFQDDWKVNHKLTINIGTRYYFYIPYHDITKPQTLDSNFIPSLYSQSVAALLDSSGNIVKDPASGHISDYTGFGNGLYVCGSKEVPKGCTHINRWTIAPRFGFAYDPFGTGKTVIRGGYGMYFEAFNQNETSALTNPPPTTLVPNAFNIVGYNNLVPGPYGPAGFTIVSLYEHLPSIQQFSFGVQHEFTGNNLLSVSYVGSLGRHLARSRDPNQVPLGLTTVNVPSLAGTPGCDASGNCDAQNVLINNNAPPIFFRPFRGYDALSLKEPTAVSSYNSLQVSFRHAFGHGLTYQLAYTWAHNIDDSTSTYFQSGVDDTHLTRWRATSDLNRAQVLVMNYVYDLPFFRKASNSFLRGGLGGWTVSGITSFFTGQQVDFSCGISGLSSGIGGGVRCNSLGPLKIRKGVYNDPQFGPTPTWVDPSVIGQVTLDQLLANNQPGMFGYMGRNPLTGPGRNNWDLAVLKNFQTPWFGTEHSSIQFRLETFNTFNHTQWKYINVGCSGSTAPGAPCTGPDNIGNGEVGGAWSPRILQLGLKFMF